MRLASIERQRLERERAQELMPIVTRRLEEGEARAIFHDLPSVIQLAQDIRNGTETGKQKIRRKIWDEFWETSAGFYQAAENQRTGRDAG
jgi:hypothetical protein